MLRIGKLTDYALLILSHMAKTNSVMSAAVIAKMLHLTLPTVSKILKMLADANLVASRRGADGGYQLARAADQISVADVLVAMEKGIALTECCSNFNRCNIATVCTMRENWIKINQMIHTLLAKLTIIQIAEPLSVQELINGK